MAEMPDIRVEIYRGVGFRDDNMHTAWYFAGDGGGSINYTGDRFTLTSAVPPDYTHAERYFETLDSDVYKYLHIYINNCQGSWRIYLHNDETNLWELVKEDSISGMYSFQIPAGKLYDGIRIGTSNQITVDYVIFAEHGVLYPTLRVAETLEIVLPLLESGVSGAKLAIMNHDGAYSNMINIDDGIIIWVGRSGEEKTKLFHGIISDISYRGEQQQDYWIHLDCLGLGYELQNPKELMQKAYNNVNGKTILQDVVSTCCPNLHIALFLDFDNEIASNHNIVVDEDIPYNVVNELCRKAQTVGGVIGFDAYVDAAGNLHVFKRNKYTSSVDLEIESYERRLDGHRIKNKIKVYGAAEEKFPSDGDARTEQNDSETPADDGWSINAGTLSWDSTVKVVGNESLKAYNSSDTDIIWVENNFYPNIPVNAFPRGFRKLKFLLRTFIDSGGQLRKPLGIMIYLFTTDANYFYRDIVPDDEIINNFIEFDLPIGLENDAEWKKFGSPDWSFLYKMRIYAFFGTPLGKPTLYVDGFHFAEKRYVKEVSDSVSISKYGIRYQAPQVEDSLRSEAECQLKAQSLLDFLSESVEGLTLEVEGDARFTPGDKQHVVISHDNVDAYYRILEVRHVIDATLWTTILTLSNEPAMIDYTTASTSPPRYSGATVIVPKDFSTIKEAIAAVVR